MHLLQIGSAAYSVIGVGLMLSACSVSPAPAASPTEDGLSLSAASNLVYECLTERGWSPILRWDGGIEIDSTIVPKEQLDLYHADSDECWGVIDSRIANMQADEIARVYERELETRDCLIDEGFDVGDPPSEQQFIDTFQSQRWSAYGDSTVMSVLSDDEAWRSINELCRQPALSFGVG